MLDDLAVGIETEDVNTCGFLASPVQVAHMHKGQIPINRDALDLAGDRPSFVDIAHNGLQAIGEERVVLNVRAGHETRVQTPLALVEDLVIDSLDHVFDVVSAFHAGL